VTHRSDTGPFALIPVWVLDLPISHLALRTYAVHADWADRGGSHHHGRRMIAERLGCSVQAVDDAHKALVGHKALRIERRRDAVGDPTSNRYVVYRAAPGVAKQETLPSQAGDATGSQAGDALTRISYVNHQEASPAPPEKPLPKAELKARVRALRRQEDASA
jgi:hypothetical protein